MSKKIPSQDLNCKGNCKCNCVDNALEIYRKAAEVDDFLFGNYDVYEAYKEDEGA